MSEQLIQKRIYDYLQSEGHYVVKVITASKAGVPDLLACVKGKFIGIEVKKPNKRGNTSKLQDYNLERIAKAGGVSMVACSVEDVKNVIGE